MNRRHKYGAVRTVVDNITFASKAEARRYQELKILQQSGFISGLTLQPTYALRVNGLVVCTYKADFAYVEAKKSIVEDVKGYKTPVYRLKKKLFEAIYRVKILETK